MTELEALSVQYMETTFLPHHIFIPITLDHREETANHGSGLGAGVGLAAVGVVETALGRRQHGQRPGPRAALHDRRRHDNEQADLREEENQEDEEAVVRHGLDLVCKGVPTLHGCTPSAVTFLWPR